MNRRRLRKIALPLLVALVVTAAALAYWTTTGSGSSSADATSSTDPVTLSAGTPTAPLIPGGSGDVKLTVSNPNPFPVHVGSIGLDSSQGTSGFDTNQAGCAVSVLHFTGTTQDNSGNGWNIPAASGGNDGTLAVDLPTAVSMDSSAANACQDASFTVYLQAGS